MSRSAFLRTAGLIADMDVLVIARVIFDQDKAYMAAVSPWFFTHYGKTGDWAWNK